MLGEAGLVVTGVVVAGVDDRRGKIKYSRIMMVMVMGSKLP